MARKPFEHSGLASYVDSRVLELKPRKSQLQIASEAGYANPNMVSQIKSGATKLALDRVPSMAKALETDPAYLMRLALAQSEGDLAASAILEIFGTPVTANELGWLEALRDASDDSDPRITSRSRSSVRAIFGK